MGDAYFNGANSPHWDDAANWWTDDSYTTAYGSAPISGDNVWIDATIYASSYPDAFGSCICGSVDTVTVFDVNLSSGSTFAYVYFNSYSQHSGTLNCDDVRFYNNAANLYASNTTFVNGTNITFDNDSYNDGNCNGVVTFSSSSYNHGYCSTAVFLNTTHNAVGGVVDYGEWHNSSYNDGQCNLTSSFWEDSYATTNAIHYGDGIFYTNSYNAAGTWTGDVVYGNSGGTDTSHNETQNITGTLTFYASTFNGGGIYINDAEFHDSSHNSGIVVNATTFDGDSYNEGECSNNATFSGSSYNASAGTIAGTATFNEYSHNNGTLDVAYFNGASHNEGTLIGSTPSEFRNYSYNNGTVEYAQFYNSAYNSLNVNISAEFKTAGTANNGYLPSWILSPNLVASTVGAYYNGSSSTPTFIVIKGALDILGAGML